MTNPTNHGMPNFSPKQGLMLSFGIFAVVLLHLGLLYLLRQNFRDLAPDAVEWWAGRGAGMVGGIFGGGVGLIGGLVGALCGSGVARRFTLGLMGLMCVVGGIATVTGIVAIVSGQPYHVWYPLMLSGPMSFLLFGGLIPVARHAYRLRELQKIDAMDS